MEDEHLRGSFNSHDAFVSRSYLVPLYQMMRPIYPGQFHSIGLNLHQVIFVLDLSKISSIEIITSAVATLIQRGLPLRFGLVPAVESNDGGKDAGKLVLSLM